MQDPRVSGPNAPFKDRSGRLALFGALAILSGACAAALGLLHVLLLVGAGRLPGLDSLPADARSYAMGALLYLLVGVALIWIGTGSLRRRRWVRPLMLTLAWTWLLTGVCVLFLLPGVLDLALGAGLPDSPPLDPAVVRLVETVLMLGTALFGVILPALFVWVYNDPQLRRTCEVHDPCPDWTECCPPVVLGLSVGLGACGVVAALSALRPAVPAFGWLLTGWPGAVSLLAGAGLCLWLARETYALRMRGWWVTIVFLLLLGLSTWLTLERVPPAEIFRALGYPEDALPPARMIIGPAVTWMSAVLTVLTVVYMVMIRKHFRTGPRPTEPDDRPMPSAG